jgi:5-methylcytosine-specific restriction endonuclease McrA
MGEKRPSYTAILKAAKAKCENCGTHNNLSINHIKPLALGGTNNAENLQILCRKCHDGYHDTSSNLFFSKRS